ncbi:phenylalanine--tRNA ligase subunit alpha [Candidatus Roizmanbacteria bacterium CG09_land_8_20_14_0_10_41_9]|uniref:Phenylalanine--tRNA ligase alpha subunit n=1 Tax=Candidatus Roizmanbacteria bacterium CG09_land_8_20_14_0_10_41_9 TaxID=1974850 RepID=A0A2H0WU39_9BACT|nr:MAG: phenylalanine--tRNA ligase subunit alpha [Candidatus Roizmanbacteria bacterium CG09_land_8_20_14_0_10_41_9]
MDDVSKLSAKFETDIKSVRTYKEAEALAMTYLGRNGHINSLLKTMKDLPTEKRKALGSSVNEIKKSIVEHIEKKRKELMKKMEEETDIDVTLPGKAYPAGSLHMVTLAIEEISRIFEKLGFVRMSYPEVEWEYYSFEALNMPKNHPARDDFESFFIDTPSHDDFGKMVLSPHTSSGQVREMLRVGAPPIRMINIAKCYRPNWDVTHTPMFHQFEGLCVDKGITIANLKGTIDYFVKEFFGRQRSIRLRPFHFQFTEPSFEIDVSCGICLGKGTIRNEKCKVCKSGWLELAGAGMVHPNVLKAGGIDPDEFSGWAFGFGIERPMMMKEGLKLNDMRIMYSGDIRFLEQF